MTFQNFFSSLFWFIIMLMFVDSWIFDGEFRKAIIKRISGNKDDD